MGRRSFFKIAIVAIVGFFGTKVGASQSIKLRPGQLWWDKDCCWTSGWKEAQKICLLLSADTEVFQNERISFWSVAEFYWCTDSYMGAPIRKFTEEEVRKMYYVGDVKQIKGFGQDKQESI